MDLAREIIGNIVAWLLLAALAELILPEGGLRRPIRLIMGLVLIIGVVLPLAGIEAADLPEADWVWAGAGEDYAAMGQDLANRWQDEANRDYGEQMERQIAAVAALTPGVLSATAHVTVDGQGGLQGVELVIIPDGSRPAERVREEAMATVSGFYLVDSGMIECHWGEVSRGE